MESELREILEEIRPDINFDAETQLIDGGILDPGRESPVDRLSFRGGLIAL